VEIVDREYLLMIEQPWKYPNNDRPRRTRPIGDQRAANSATGLRSDRRRAPWAAPHEWS